MDIRAGDRISSKRHKGELMVAVSGRRILVCRKMKKDGAPGDQEVLVHRDDVAALRLRLPMG